MKFDNWLFYPHLHKLQNVMVVMLHFLIVYTASLDNCSSNDKNFLEMLIFVNS